MKVIVLSSRKNTGVFFKKEVIPFEAMATQNGKQIITVFERYSISLHPHVTRKRYYMQYIRCKNAQALESPE